MFYKDNPASYTANTSNPTFSGYANANTYENAGDNSCQGSTSIIWTNVGFFFLYSIVLAYNILYQESRY